MEQSTITSKNAEYLLRSGGRILVLSQMIAVVGAILFLLHWGSLAEVSWATSFLTLAIGLGTISCGILGALADHVQLVAIASSARKFFLLSIATFAISGLIMAIPSSIWPFVFLDYLSIWVGCLFALISLLCVCVALMKAVRLSL